MFKQKHNKVKLRSNCSSSCDILPNSIDKETKTFNKHVNNVGWSMLLQPASTT